MSLTSENVEAWKSMGMKDKYVIERIADWAEMLEEKLAELYPDYRYYQWGRRIAIHELQKPERPVLEVNNE